MILRTQHPMGGRTVAGAWAYDASGPLWVPDTEYTAMPEGFEARPLRGYAHTLAVAIGSAAIGWILKENLPEVQS